MWSKPIKAANREVGGASESDITFYEITKEQMKIEKC